MQAIDEDNSVLRWGGLAGILGAFTFVLVLVIAFVGPEFQFRRVHLRQSYGHMPIDVVLLFTGPININRSDWR